MRLPADYANRKVLRNTYHKMTSSKQETAEALKKAMRQLPFPVAIATTAIGKEKRGITIGSFTSLSLDPPLISFNIDRQAQIHDLIMRATHFVVHLPQKKHCGLCDHFASPGQSSEEQFAEIKHRRNGYGSPILEKIPTAIQCRSYEHFEAGDHTIIVGEVIEINQRSEEPVILYHDRAYRSVGQKVPKLTKVHKSA